MNEDMNYKEFGKRWGITGQYVGKLVNRGTLPAHNGKIDVHKADEIMESSPVRGRYKEPLEPGMAFLVAHPFRYFINTALEVFLFTCLGFDDNRKVKLKEFIVEDQYGEFFKNELGIDIDKVKISVNPDTLIEENTKCEKHKILEWEFSPIYKTKGK